MTGGTPMYKTGKEKQYFIVYGETTLIGYVFCQNISKAREKAQVLNEHREDKIVRIKNPLKNKMYKL